MADHVCDPPARFPVSDLRQPVQRPRSSRCNRWLVWGVAVAVLYLLSGLAVVEHLPVRLLYDGLAPLAPYRWVRPPASHFGRNEAPLSGTGTIQISATGSEAVSLATDDGQAALIVFKDAVDPRRGEAVAEVAFTPLDPDSVAPPLPGRRFDGNAYRIEGAYRTSHAAVVLRKSATVVLRYPSEATELWRYDGTQWTVVRKEAGVVDASLQIYASTDQLGIFVAAAPPGGSRPALGGWAYGLAALGLVGVVVGILLSRRPRPRRARKGQRRGHREE